MDGRRLGISLAYTHILTIWDVSLLVLILQYFTGSGFHFLVFLPYMLQLTFESSYAPLIILAI